MWSSLFGKIYCINLQSRPDRRMAVKEVFSKLNLGPVEFVTVTKHPTSGEQGCFESHILCVNMAYDAGVDRVLIFEDDLRINHRESIVYFLNFIRFFGDSNWEIAYLGMRPMIGHYRTERTTFPKIYKVRAKFTHAYALSRSYMEKLRTLKYVGAPIDSVYSWNRNAFAVIPTIFSQNCESKSDLYIRPRFWRSRAMEELIEWYAVNINLTLCTLVFMLLGVSLAFLAILFFL